MERCIGDFSLKDCIINCDHLENTSISIDYDIAPIGKLSGNVNRVYHRQVLSYARIPTDPEKLEPPGSVIFYISFFPYYKMIIGP